MRKDIAAYYSVRPTTGVRLELTQPALEALSNGDVLEFGGVRVSATKDTPTLLQKHGWCSHPARTWR